MEILKEKKGGIGMGLKITTVYEPDHSCSIIKNYEEMFNISSENFYTLFKLGFNPVNDVNIATDWAFYYEIFLRTSDSFYACTEGRQAKRAGSPFLL